MFKDIRQYLESITTPEQTQLLVFGLETLRRINGDNVVTLSEELVRQAANNDSVVGLSQIYEYVIDETIKALRKFSVFINMEQIDYRKAESLTYLLYGLLEIEFYEDKAYLLSVIEDIEDEVSTLSELVSVVTDTHLDDYLTIIDRVEYSLIETIQYHLSEEHDEATEEVSTPINPMLTLFNQKDYIKYVDEIVARTLSRRPYTLNMDNILRSFGNRIADDNNGQYTWVFITLIAEESKTEIDPNLLFSRWEKHFLEELDIIKMYSLVTKIFKELLGELAND